MIQLCSDLIFSSCSSPVPSIFKTFNMFPPYVQLLVIVIVVSQTFEALYDYLWPLPDGDGLWRFVRKQMLCMLSAVLVVYIAFLSNLIPGT